MKKWYQQKTTWAAIGTIIAGLGGGLTLELAWDAALQMISTGLIGLFLRQGVNKIGGFEK